VNTCGFVGLLLSVTLRLYGVDTLPGCTPVETPLRTSYVSAHDADPSHVQDLGTKRSAVNLELSRYHYSLDASPWSFDELQSGLLKSHAVFRFESVERVGAPSVFVVLISLKGTGFRIIPLWDHGFRRGADPERRSENLKLFNQLINDERPPLSNAQERLALASFYVHLFEKKPAIVEVALGTATTSQNLVPCVRSDNNGGFEVRLYESTPRSKEVIERLFQFAANGSLQRLAKRIRVFK
jgi:hypothetical protein